MLLSQFFCLNKRILQLVQFIHVRNKSLDERKVMYHVTSVDYAVILVLLNRVV